MKVRKCKCGSTMFYSHIELHADIVCDSEGGFICNASELSEYKADSEKYLGENTPSEDVYYASDPFGPFTCTECGEEYAEIVYIPEVEDEPDPDSSCEKCVFCKPEFQNACGQPICLYKQDTAAAVCEKYRPISRRKKS